MRTPDLRALLLCTVLDAFCVAQGSVFEAAMSLSKLPKVSNRFQHTPKPAASHDKSIGKKWYLRLSYTPRRNANAQRRKTGAIYADKAKGDSSADASRQRCENGAQQPIEAEQPAGVLSYAHGHVTRGHVR